MAEQQGRTFRLPWPGAAARPPRPSTGARPSRRGSSSVPCCSGCGPSASKRGWSTCRSSSTAASCSRAQKQQMRTITAPAKRGEILDRDGPRARLQRRRRHVFADPTEIDDPDAVAAAVCGALDDCDATDRQAMAKKLRGSGQFAYLAAQGLARRRAADPRPEAEGDRVPQGEPALLSEQGAGRARARLRRPRQRRARRPRVGVRHAGARQGRQAARADRCAAAARCQPGRARRPPPVRRSS